MDRQGSSGGSRSVSNRSPVTVARKRIITPEFFAHEGLGGCSPYARILFASLWCQADREGRIRWVPMQIHGQAFPWESEPNVSALAIELEAIGCLQFYRVEGKTFAVLPGFGTWQRPHPHEPQSRHPAPDPASVFLLRDNVITKNGQCNEAIRLFNSVTLSLSDSVTLDQPSVDLVRDEAKAPRPEPAKVEERSKIHAPTGDPLLDYLLQTWAPSKLGKVDTLRAWIRKSREAFPGVDLLAEARRAAAWEESKPRNRKHKIRPFLTSWWARAQDRGGNRGGHGSSPDAEAVAIARSLGGKE